jgi:hypothetical protein
VVYLFKRLQVTGPANYGLTVKNENGGLIGSEFFQVTLKFSTYHQL